MAYVISVVTDQGKAIKYVQEYLIAWCCSPSLTGDFCLY